MLVATPDFKKRELIDIILKNNKYTFLKSVSFLFLL
jgi:hypothetical protein